jgi:hypothetical protein
MYDHWQAFVEVVQDFGTWTEQPALLASILDHYRFGTDL